jgi:NAD(P)-dependent dehydrogenase (short-subunit alcohol dehydrogenase family)
MSGREGHVALVTGAGTGIGKATACLLAERGMHVALVGRRRELLEETARTIEAAGCNALVLPGDLADPTLPQQLVQDTLQALGRLDVLVNNAATIAVGPLDAFTVEQIDRHLAEAALEYLTRASAYELADRRIRVNCIAPGPVETPIHEVWADDLEAAYADLSRRVPLGRIGSTGRDRHLGLDARRSGLRVDHRQCDPRRRRPGARAAAGRRRLGGTPS